VSPNGVKTAVEAAILTPRDKWNNITLQRLTGRRRKFFTTLSTGRFFARYSALTDKCGRIASQPINLERITMTKLLSSLLAAVFAVAAVSPVIAAEKKEEKKAEVKKEEKKAEKK